MVVGAWVGGARRISGHEGAGDEGTCLGTAVVLPTSNLMLRQIRGDELMYVLLCRGGCCLRCSRFSAD
jgi:hypothetical protein